MAKAENTYKEVTEIKSRIKKLETMLAEEQEYLEKKRYQYRTERVCEILGFIRSQYGQGNIVNLDTILCHCQNKLLGNLDGIEITLDEHLIDENF